MKNIVAAFLLVALTGLPAVAATGGISGHIVDAKSGTALSGVPVEVYRMPVQKGDDAVVRLRTDRHGFFVMTALPTGRYLVAALANGRSFGCTVDDVFDSFTTRFTLGVGEDNTVCTGPRVHSAIVNSDITADLTVWH